MYGVCKCQFQKIEVVTFCWPSSDSSKDDVYYSIYVYYLSIDQFVCLFVCLCVFGVCLYLNYYESTLR